jgi:hypothetical protein
MKRYTANVCSTYTFFGYYKIKILESSDDHVLSLELVCLYHLLLEQTKKLSRNLDFVEKMRRCLWCCLLKRSVDYDWQFLMDPGDLVPSHLFI